MNLFDPLSQNGNLLFFRQLPLDVEVSESLTINFVRMRRQHVPVTIKECLVRE